MNKLQELQTKLRIYQTILSVIEGKSKVTQREVKKIEELLPESEQFYVHFWKSGDTPTLAIKYGPYSSAEYLWRDSVKYVSDRCEQMKREMAVLENDIATLQDNEQHADSLRQMELDSRQVMIDIHAQMVEKLAAIKRNYTGQIHTAQLEGMPTYDALRANANLLENYIRDNFHSHYKVEFSYQFNGNQRFSSRAFSCFPQDKDTEAAKVVEDLNKTFGDRLVSTRVVEKN